MTYCHDKIFVYGLCLFMLTMRFYGHSVPQGSTPLPSSEGRATP